MKQMATASTFFAFSRSTAFATSSSASGATSAPSWAMRPATSIRQSRGAGGMGFGNIEIEIVRAALARELEHVAKACGRDHAGARPLALEHRVGGERGAEHERGHIAARQPVLVEQLGDAVEDALRRIGRLRRHLVISVAPALGVDRDEIGERAAGVYADEDLAHAFICYETTRKDTEYTKQEKP